MNKTSAVVEYNVNGAKAVGKQAMDSALSNVKDTVRSGVAKTVSKQAMDSALSNVKDTVRSSVAKTQDVLLEGLDATQELLKDQQKRSAKKVKKAQKRARKNVKNLQGAVESGLSQTQDILLTGLSTAQDAIDKNTKRASKGLKKTQKNFTGTRNSKQNMRESRVRRRQRARTIFRLGILLGFVLVLLYTPWTGSEIRRQLLEVWNSVFPSQEQ